MTCALYRHFGADGALLYVGISQRPVLRLAEHARSSGWRGEIVRVELEHFDTREAAEAAEKAAIASERPLWNIAHTVGDDAMGVINVLGRAELCAALGVKNTAISQAFKNNADGLLPPAWFKVMRDMGRVRGVEVSEDLFAWKCAGHGGARGISKSPVFHIGNVPSVGGASQGKSLPSTIGGRA